MPIASSAVPTSTLLPPATTGITSTMTAALLKAQTYLQTLVGSGTLENLSLMQLQNAIAAFEVAFNVYAAGLVPPSGISLDAVIGGSTLDGYNDFVTEAHLVTDESDIQLALFYIGRIISNLMLAAG